MKLTVKQLAEKRPYLTEASIRWILFNRKTNGFNRAVIKIGKKLIINDEIWEECENACREVAA